ncbi:M1 family aminopeptidase [Taibaiella koreensis]|uniref:M1 family aminopeptidase n=1 Tax=Taibaiella koreensis TaxID=1268548 RepID=UPI000E59916D|nr:M1 family aminopeptidase [Taibaiella koreensis]
MIPAFLRKKIFSVAVACGMALSAGAQTEDASYGHCSRYKQQASSVPYVADPREETYDVRYVKLDVVLDNLSPQLSGNAYTRAVVRDAPLEHYVFELSDGYTIDSLRLNGAMLPVATAGSLREVSLPSTLPPGALLEVLVYYHGQPAAGAGFFSAGIRTEVSPEWHQSITYTLSEPYFARDWWPVKQSLADKIDSSDVWITVPESLKAGSNGKLEQITVLPGGRSRFEWKSRYPIDYYLISVAVGPYTDYSYYMHFDGSTDSMLVQNYIYSDTGAFTSYKPGMDATAEMVRYFSGLFGRYPFWKEKYGHCTTPLGGGMEHQTMTTLNNFGTSLVAHELGHQWFGDHVTCASWADIWLNEGMATYLDYLFRSHAEGAVSGAAIMSALHDQARSIPDGSVYCADTTATGRIFSYQLSYCKGAVIAHTLRYVFDNDSLFFAMLKGYQEQYAYGTAGTEQIKAVAASFLGRNLDTFFTQWIYGQGYPVYQARWNQVGDQVLVHLEQAGSAPASVALFRTPLPIRIYGSGGDTIVRADNRQPAETFAFTWNRPVDSIALDPEHHVLLRTDSIRRDHSLLSLQGFDTSLYLVYPNPTADSWLLEGIPTGCRLVLYDIAGKRLWQGTNGNSTAIRIGAGTLSRGLYLLKVNNEGAVKQTLKLLRL